MVQKRYDSQKIVYSFDHYTAKVIVIMVDWYGGKGDFLRKCQKLQRLPWVAMYMNSPTSKRSFWVILNRFSKVIGYRTFVYMVRNLRSKRVGTDEWRMSFGWRSEKGTFLVKVLAIKLCYLSNFQHISFNVFWTDCERVSLTGFLCIWGETLGQRELVQMNGEWVLHGGVEKVHFWLKCW